MPCSLKQECGGEVDSFFAVEGDLFTERLVRRA